MNSIKSYLLAGLVMGSTALSAAHADEFSDWKPPAAGGRVDDKGGRAATAALLLEQPKETITEPWLSSAQPVSGSYVRASAWMKAQDLYYLDFGFFAYAAIEFLDGGGKVIKEEPFLLSRELMLSEPLLLQRMETHGRLLNFDWRYGERTIPVAQGAKQARVRFALSQRTTGRAWLDDVQLTFSDTPEPAAIDSAQAITLPEVEVRLRSNAVRRLEDPLGHIFFPGEDADFYAQIPRAAAGKSERSLVATVNDSEGFVLWKNTYPLKEAGEWVKVTLPSAVAAPYLGRFLEARFEMRNGEEPAARTTFSFGYLNEFRREAVREGLEERYIVNLRTSWNSARHSRFWMQRSDNLTTCSLHIKNIWKDGTQPPNLNDLPPFYQRPDVFNGKFNYSVVALIAGGEPNLIPEFSHLGHHALPTPESIGAFMRAAVRRFPHIKYWKALNEMYRQDVPGYREAFVKCQKAFYEGVKAENPDAVVILDNSSVRAEAKALFDLGLFNYCDAIDPHLYGQVEDIMFGFFKKEKEQLESWGVHKRWISMEADPIPGAGATGIESRWVSEEIPKMLGAFFGMGGEKICLLGSGAIANPTDPFYADAHGGPNFIPTINYFAYRRFVDQIGLKPTGGSHVLGDMKVRYQRFDGPDNSVVVLWSPTGENTVQVESAGGIRVVDNVRTDLALNAANGIHRVTVGVQPVYITGSRQMKVSLAATPAVAAIEGGGIVVGKPNSVVLNVPDSAAKTATLFIPPGVTVAQKTVPVQNGKAEFSLSIPASHDGSLITLLFSYGQRDVADSMLVHRFELIRPISAEIWSDAAMKEGKPQFMVRVSNTNPVEAVGKIVARAPVTNDARPTEVSVPFKVKAKSSVDLPVVFPAAALPKAADEQNAWPAVAFVYPEGSEAFAVRDRVNLASLPKVRPGLRIDGDLSDWPEWSGANVHEVASAIQFVAANENAKPGDIRTQIQASWDRATLYFGVRVRGADAARSQGIRILLNNPQDKRTAGYEVKTEQRSYTIRPAGDTFALEAISQSPDARGVVYNARRVADGIDYEIAIPVWEAANVLQIDPDRWIRLSLAICDTDGKSAWQWFGGGKSPKDYDTFGAFQLAAYGVNEWGQPYGCPFAGGGRKRDGFVGLAILPGGDRVRVRATAPDKSTVEVVHPDGSAVRKFDLAVGQGIHSVDVDRQGRLVVGDRVAGVNFYSPENGEVIPVGPTRGFYPKRHIIEYRSQGFTQDAEGNYFVTIVRKRRAGPAQPCPVVLEGCLTKISGLTMFDPQGVEVKTFGKDIVVTDAMAPLRVFGNMGERAGAFLYAESVAIDKAASLWVTDIDAQTLQIFARRSAGVYDESPIVYVKLPADCVSPQVRALPDGRMLFWNEKQMRIATLENGIVQFASPVSFKTPIRDLKIENNNAITLDATGTIGQQPLP